MAHASGSLVQVPTEIPRALRDSRQRCRSRMDRFTGVGGQKVRRVGDPKYLRAGLGGIQTA